MNEYWAYFPNVLEAEWCDALVEHATSNYPSENATMLTDDGDRYDTNTRNCQVRWMKPGIEKTLSHSLWEIVSKANGHSFNVDITHFVDFQFTTYTGTEDRPALYDWHHDVDWTYKGSNHRKLSMTILLSEYSDYEGGMFQFLPPIPSLPEEMQTKGTVIVFPSMHFHRVAPVTSGTRHSLVTWAEGPKWK